jgi:hypothetical protein
VLLGTLYRVTKPLREIALWQKWRVYRFVLRLTQTTAGDVRRFDRDLHMQPDFLAHVSAALDKYQQLEFGAGAMCEAELLYILVRALRPEVVVETGVASGRSTAFILQALEDNGVGHLHSIDLPRHYGDEVPYEAFDAYLPPGKESGWIVPQQLRHRWTLHLGTSRRILPSLLAGLPRLGMFLHDSEHTYDNMMWEYETAWPHMASGGVLLSHDVVWNSAFEDFCRARGVQPVVMDNVGGVVSDRGKMMR